MSISEDIERLEEALKHGSFEWWDAAANPDRIRRLLDALIDEESRHFRSIAFSNMETTRANVAEARLSKAIDLLKEARPTVLEAAVAFGEPDEARLVASIDAFLKEVSE